MWVILVRFELERLLLCRVERGRPFEWPPPRVDMGCGACRDCELLDEEMRSMIKPNDVLLCGLRMCSDAIVWLVEEGFCGATFQS